MLDEGYVGEKNLNYWKANYRNCNILISEFIKK